MITVAAGEIQGYQGSETNLLLRYFLSKTISFEGDTFPSGNPEEGEFFQEATATAAGGTIDYVQHDLPSTDGATPARGKVTLALFTAAGELV